MEYGINLKSEFDEYADDMEIFNEVEVADVPLPGKRWNMGWQPWW